MLHHASRLALIAAILLPTVACEDYTAVPAKAPSSDDAPSIESLESQLRATEATLEATRAETAADPSAKRAPPRAAPAPRQSLPAFVAGGEQRIECPVGYHAAEADGVGCECASSTDASTLPASRTEVACSTNGRAEADECIFTCPGAESATD